VLRVIDNKKRRNQESILSSSFFNESNSNSALDRESDEAGEGKSAGINDLNTSFPLTFPTSGDLGAGFEGSGVVGRERPSIEGLGLGVFARNWNTGLNGLRRVVSARGRSLSGVGFV
jgi:hypothetical protein